MNVDIECVDHIDPCQFTWQTGAMANVKMLQDPASAAVDAGAECCAPPVREAIAAEGAEKLAKTLKAIADPARLRLISMVASHDDAEACVCDLTEPLNVGQPTVSHHLRVLTDAGFVTRSKRGTWAYYKLVPGALDALSRLLVTA